MQIVLDSQDLQRLSEAARREVLAMLNPPLPTTGPAAPSRRLRWRAPYDLNEEQAVRLLQALPEKHRARLALFANRNGRVRIADLMAVSGDSDLRETSAFVKEVTRRLRRLIDDPDKIAQLIQWDFDSTKWDAGRTTIIDGIYYVSTATAHSLRKALGLTHRAEAKPQPALNG